MADHMQFMPPWDAAAREIMAEERAYNTFRRLLVGYLGRREAAAKRTELAYARRKEWAEKMEQARKDADKRVREREAELRRKNRIAITIQRNYRGLLGRRRWKGMLQYKLETLVAIKFQAAFRGLVGRNVAYGRVRHQENVEADHLQLS